MNLIFMKGSKTNLYLKRVFLSRNVICHETVSIFVTSILKRISKALEIDIDKMKHVDFN